MAASQPISSNVNEYSNTDREPADMIEQAVRSLVHTLADNVSKNRPSSAMSVCIYDTAWVSMVSKQHDGEAKWLFPEAFEYLLVHQDENGSWKKPADSELDGIINTMAALLACLIHRRSNLETASEQSDISSRVEKATTWLQAILTTWDARDCDQVGFEVLLPSMSRFLRTEGVTLSFPAMDHLLRVQDQKLAKLDPSSLYNGTQASIVHCLESLIGLLDFNRLEPLLRNGSMMGSPSATAAFLINSSRWNDEAESYLRIVHTNGAGRQSGAFPSAYPAEIFETSWVLSTLLEAGLPSGVFDKSSLTTLRDMLSESLKRGGDAVGFSASMLPDADDTSKSLQSLYLLDHHEHNLDTLICEFNGTACFRTYAEERNASFSANCNVIKAVLQSRDGSLQIQHLESAIRFVCQCWNRKNITDKWNTSQEYSQMLLSQVLTKFLRASQWPEYSNVSPDLSVIASKVATQILSHVLRTQETKGSWGTGSSEVTAYAVLTLTALATLPQFRYLSAEIKFAVQHARAFLTVDFGKWEPSQVWVEKVTYSSPVLTNTYCLAAIHASQPDKMAIAAPVGEADEKSKHLQMFFSQLPMFRNVHDISLIMKTAFLEARQCIRDLRAVQHDIFPPRPGADEKYLEYIPITWIACNNTFGSPLSPALLCDMMEISMLNFQADAYIETTVKTAFEHDLSPVRRLVDRICRPSRSDAIIRPDGILKEIEAVLAAYATRVLSNDSVRISSRDLQDDLRGEFAEYLQAQITSIEDNKRLTLDSADQPHPRPSLFDWARTTGANHTSCPYSYTYFLCLISADAGYSECFHTPTQKFVGRALHRHLATTCRLHNDYGSYARDLEEGTFNSFACREVLGELQARDEEVSDGQLREAKRQLLKIAEFERQGLDAAMATLAAEGVLDAFMDKIRLFVNVTNLYGEIYIARDIGTKSQ